MKPGRLIARIILYAILLAAVAATYVALNVLRTPAPPMPGDELEAFAASLAERTGGVLAARLEALDRIQALGEPEPGPKPMYAADRGLGYEAAKDAASRILEERVGVIEAPLHAGGLLPPGELDETLNAADRLYKERATEGTAMQELIFRDAMMAESPDYIRWLGYNMLTGTLGRDVIRYRVKESLQLHETKSTLYRTETDTIRNRLDASRSDARNLAAAAVSELDSRYDALIAELVSRTIESSANGGAEPARAGIAVLDDLRARLYAFAGVRPHRGLEVPPSDVPVSDRTAWLAPERLATDQFERDSAYSGEE